ncbi:sensor histidine kinase [Gulosibacter sp. 10]|uniref:sensor histidine kinase n=1 Tax=Gulosibacter sp. 10 TaxID=1255570 RepID=UPI00097EBABC|nr:histidine kinase [Gulosibacter sp. 10]SJM65021.1 putative two-component system sensor kinase [Gulosibacter sp. 10]
MTDAEGRLRDRLVESLLACGALLVLCVLVLAAEPEATPAAFLAVAGFGALAVLGARLPRLALVLTVLGIFAYYTVDLPPLGMVLPATASLYLAAARGRTIWAAGGAAVLLAIATYFRLTGGDDSARFAPYEYVTEVALAAAAIALGLATRLARERRRQAQRIAELVAAEQAHAVERQLDEQRLRIARDLHDSVGHGLTVAALHASVAAEELETADASAAAREAVELVRTANAGTLRELRHAVRTLRSDRPGAGDPGLDESSADPSGEDDPGAGAPDADPLGADPLDTDPLGAAPLVRTAEQAGILATVDIGALPPLPPELAAAARGILTEAVTNVLRHAGARELRIAARAAEGGLELEVVDDGAGASSLRGGSGVPGMRERAELLGGALRVRSRPGRGCAVRARLPLGAGAGSGSGAGEGAAP